MSFILYFSSFPESFLHKGIKSCEEMTLVCCVSIIFSFVCDITAHLLTVQKRAMISESVTDVAGSKMRSDVITFEFRYAAIL